MRADTLKSYRIRGYKRGVAIILTSTKNLPPRTKPMPPGAKPPVTEFKHQDPVTDPSDLDEFLMDLNEMKGKGRRPVTIHEPDTP